MKNKQQGFIIPLIIAIIAVFAIGGGIYGRKMYLDNNGVNQSGTSALITATSTNVASDLKTYQNAKYGFGFNYPPTWELRLENDLEDSSEIILSKDNSNLSIGSSYVKIYPN